MKRRPYPDGDRKALVPEERERLLCLARSWPDRQAALLVRLVYETASRISEVLHLRFEDYRPQAGEIEVRRLKGSAPVRAAVTPDLGALLQGARGLVFAGDGGRCDRPGCPSGHLCRSWAWREIDRLGEAARIPEGLRHPHALRHTRLCDVARLLGQQGCGPQMILAELRRLSGHRSASALMVYFDAPEDRAGRRRMILEATRRMGTTGPGHEEGGTLAHPAARR